MPNPKNKPITGGAAEPVYLVGGEDGALGSLTVSGNTAVSSVALPVNNPLVDQITISGSPPDRFSAVSVPLVVGQVLIWADDDNTDPITVGGADVTADADGTGNGLVVKPGQMRSAYVSDLNRLYANGTAGDWLSYSAS